MERNRRSIPLPPNKEIRWLSKDEAIAQGYVPFFGFLLPFEYWMVDSVVEDLKKAGRKFCGTRDPNGSRGIMIEAKPR